MKRTILFLLLPVFLNKSTMAQQPFLTIYYYYAEKSRDSHSTTEQISIGDSTLLYSVKYTGRKGPNQKDEVKTCKLTRDQLEKINKVINDKQLNVTDSIISNTTGGSGFQVTTNVIITITRSGKTTLTKTRGYVSDLTGKPLYDNSLYLIRKIKAMVELCR